MLMGGVNICFEAIQSHSSTSLDQITRLGSFTFSITELMNIEGPLSALDFLAIAGEENVSGIISNEADNLIVREFSLIHVPQNFGSSPEEDIEIIASK